MPSLLLEPIYIPIVTKICFQYPNSKQDIFLPILLIYYIVISSVSGHNIFMCSLVMYNIASIV
jgi:hypothetical protein